MGLQESQCETEPSLSRYSTVLFVCLLGAFLAGRAWFAQLSITALGGSPIVGWCATFLLLLTLPWLWRQPQTLRGREWIKSLWPSGMDGSRTPYLLVTLVLVVALWPIPVGTLPISQDHGNHYLATHIFVYDMVANGHLFGWTDRIGVGLPFGDVYGTMAYLVTGALTLLSFGLLPLSVSYSFGIFLVWWIPSMAIVAWARRLGVGSLAPVVAGCLFVLDAGGDREGGWVYSMFHGVWPQLLATGVWLWTLLSLVRLMEKQTWRRFGAVIVLTGLALWAHPMNAINLPLSSALLVMWSLLKWGPDESATSSSVGGLWSFLALGLGGIIGCLWLVHLFVAAPYLGEYTAYWKSLPSLMHGLLQGELFDNQIAAFGLLSLVGIVGVWRRQQRLGLFSLVLCAGFLLVGSMDLFALFDLGLHPSHKLFMFRRLSVSIKPFWFVFAGIGTALLWEGWQRISVTRAVPLPAKILFGVAMAPLVWSSAVAMPRLIKSPVLRTMTAERAELTLHLKRIRQAMRQESKRFPKRILRMVQWRANRGDGSYGLFLVADENWSSLPTSTPPCQAFVWGNALPNFKMMKWFGATHLLSLVPQKRSDLTLLVRSGRYFLYRIELKQTSYPVRLEGPGKVEVLSWKPMQRRLRLSGVSFKSRLIIGLPPYHKWVLRYEPQTTGRGSQNSNHKSQLSLKLYPWKGFRISRVSGLSNGILTLTYQSKTIEVIFLWLGGFVLLLALVFLGLGHRELPLRLTEAWGHRISLFSGWFLMAGIVGGFLMLFWLQEVAVQSEYAEPKFPRVLQVLHSRGLSSFDYSPKPYCVPPFDRRLRTSCHEYDLKPRLVPGPRRWERLPKNIRVVPGAENYANTQAKQSKRLGIRYWNRIPSCLLFGIPGRGKSVLRFRLPPNTRLLKGQFHWSHGEIYRILLLNGKPHLLSGHKPFRIALSPHTKDVMLIVHSRKHMQKICLELVALGESKSP